MHGRVPLSHVLCVSGTRMPVMRAQLCRGQQSFFVVRGRAPLLLALCANRGLLGWSVACAWPSHAQLCRGRHNSLSWSSLSRPTNPLSWQKFSLPWPTLSEHRLVWSRHNFSLPWPTLLRPKNPLSRHKIFLAWLTMLRHRIAPSQHKTSPFGNTLS